MRIGLLRLGRSFVITIAEIFIVLVLIVGAIQTNQWIFRYRAERLLRDITSIELRRTTLEQLSPILGRWSGYIHYDLPCSKQHCDLTIRFSQPVEFGDQYLYPRTLYLWPTARKQPEYRIGWGPNDRLGIQVAVKFTPFADPIDIKRLAQINFSCLTRWISCRTRENIMPVAIAERSTEKHFPWDGSEAPSCDMQTTRLLSRDADNVALVEVTESKPVVGPYRYLKIRARLLKRLKRTLFWKLDDQKTFDVSDIPTRVPIEGLGTIKPGDRLIIIFEWRADVNAVAGFAPEECGVVPYSEGNLAIAQEGISQDERVPPYLEYDLQFRPGKFSDPPESPWETLHPTNWY